MRSLVIGEENSKTHVCFVENSIVTQYERKLLKEPNEYHFSLNKGLPVPDTAAPSGHRAQGTAGPTCCGGAAAE